jgi:hypothetical protein
LCCVADAFICARVLLQALLLVLLHALLHALVDTARVLL